MNAAAQTTVPESVSWDTKPSTTDYQSSLSAIPTSTVIPKTVDYGHGHGMGCKNEHSLTLLTDETG